MSAIARVAIVPLHEQIRALVNQGATPPLRRLLRDSDPLAIADAFYYFNVLEQMTLLGLLPAEQSARVLVELNDSALTALLSGLEADWLARRVALLEPDDGVHLVRLMEAEQMAAVMDALEPPLRKALTQLLTYAEDTAGGIMDPDVVRVRADQTVGEAIAQIRRYVETVELDDFFSVFVVSPDDVLVGAVPAWKMLLAAPEERIEDIMIADVISVEAHLDQEEVSRIVMNYDLVTVPVVDLSRRLIGRITVDDIVDVLHEEFHEDVARITGTGSEEIRELSIVSTLRLRTPWLLIALAGEFLLAVVLRGQEGLLSALPQLAFFIPLIMAMAGNVGLQSSTLVIRGLATGEVHLSHFWRRLGREVTVALSVGTLFAVLLVGGGWLLTGNIRLGATVGVAVMLVILQAASFGTTLPMLLKRLGLDPALATGPFLTMLNDILGMVVYLLTALVVLF